MRRCCVMMLTVVVLLTILGAASAAAEIETTPPDCSDNYGIPTKRFLRTRKSLANDEERSVGTSAVESVLKSTVIDQQIEAVLQKAKSADDAFKRLKLNKAGDALLDSPELKAWIKYMKQFNQQNPTKKTTLVATLTAHYGDEGLAKLVEAAKLVPTTKQFAKRLETEQVQRWLVLGKSPDDVFKLVKLHKAGSKFFDKPKLNIWVKYVDDFNKQNPTQKKTLIARLTKQYNDKSLTYMLIAAKKNPSTKSIATRIQSEQTLLWLKNGKTPEDLFKLLRLNKAGDTLFANPLFPAWIKYADDFRLVHPDTELATFSTLAKPSMYNDETLASMIMAADKVPATREIAGRLHSEQLRYWLLKGENPDDIFMLLKLFNADDKLIENPLFTVWVKYLNYYNQMNLKTKWNLIKTLTSRFGDSSLSSMLTAAAKVPSTKEVATELQRLQINGWLSDRKSTTLVYKLLRVEGTAADDANSLLYKKYAEDIKKLSE
ncbi:RxLR effector protein PSR2 [Phytophthora ramorum]|uniref:RxLR effector protein PSR2 n=1 Tax=Phytophthora ramorum TaxID=164328 RepID=UPI0030A429A7|nr:RxLR effector protein PSR2 [Phytophthora ramorum]